jgi:hypothetical protein
LQDREYESKKLEEGPSIAILNLKKKRLSPDAFETTSFSLSNKYLCFR